MDKSPETTPINRRELLKALGAAGGVLAAAAFLPGKWARPVVEAGVMPAHAQSSALTIFSLSIQQQAPARAAAVPFDFYGEFSYNDPLGQVDSSALLTATTAPCSLPVYTGQSLASIGAAFLTGSDAFNGGIRFGFNGLCNTSDPQSLYVTLEAGGRTSNTISAPYPFT